MLIQKSIGTRTTQEYLLEQLSKERIELSRLYLRYLSVQRGLSQKQARYRYLLAKELIILRKLSIENNILALFIEKEGRTADIDQIIAETVIHSNLESTAGKDDSGDGETELAGFFESEPMLNGFDNNDYPMLCRDINRLFRRIVKLIHVDSQPEEVKYLLAAEENEKIRQSLTSILITAKNLKQKKVQDWSVKTELEHLLSLAEGLLEGVLGKAAESADVDSCLPDAEKIQEWRDGVEKKSSEFRKALAAMLVHPLNKNFDDPAVVNEARQSLQAKINIQTIKKGRLINEASYKETDLQSLISAVSSINPELEVFDE